MTTRGGTLAALLTALARPSWWILALAGFLVRGGLVIFLLAIITLPSPLALSNVLAPMVTALFLGSPDVGYLALLASAVATVVAWVLAGGWFAAATEVVLIQDARQAARDEGLPVGPDRPAGRLLIARSAAAHLLALLPAALVLGLGSIQIIAVIYRELVNPSGASPIALRVIGGATGAIAAIVVVWLLGELVGGMAVRRIVVQGESIVGAVLHAAGDLVRRPGGSLIAPLVTTAVLIVDLAAVLAVVMLVWSEVRTRLIGPLDQPLATGLAVATLGAAWCLALLVTGLIDAWRSVAMTFEAERAAADAEPRSANRWREGSSSGAPDGGTIGASTQRRPGDWSAGDRGGSL